MSNILKDVRENSKAKPTAYAMGGLIGMKTTKGRTGVIRRLEGNISPTLDNMRRYQKALGLSDEKVLQIYKESTKHI